MKAQPIQRWDREIALLAWLSTCVSILSFVFYFRRGDILLYGDAVAHINIARRVFDSRTSGLLQLGTVWLPLPHLLMIPFLISNWMWKTGVGGSIPSMVAYVFGTAGVFRLVRDGLGANPSSASPTPTPTPMIRVAAWLAAIVYATNPNLIYLQATAMTEPLYLALFIWSLVYFNEFVRLCAKVEDKRAKPSLSPLIKCGMCIAAASLTRYDAWILVFVMCVAAIMVVLRATSQGQNLTRQLGKFFLLAAAAPVFWLGYNAIVYRNPLEFANGPYSAKAIEQRSSATSHPGSNDIRTAFSYFLKSAELNLEANDRGQKIWILLAMAGLIATLFRAPRMWPLLFLGIPLAFYTLSVAYSGVPIYVPVWWPFSHYNVRYGLELLPGFAVFVAVAVYFAARLMQRRWFRIAIPAAGLIFVIASYASIWSAPVCFREALVNSRGRIALERELADFLKVMPPDSSLLMYLGNHVGAVQQAGIPLRRVINEGNHRTWKQPVDQDGLWERTLANPSRFVDFVIAFEGDAVSNGVRKDELVPLAVLHSSDEPKATIYRTRVRSR
jgi:hypothetical protein